MNYIFSKGFSKAPSPQNEGGAFLLLSPGLKFRALCAMLGGAWSTGFFALCSLLCAPWLQLL
jgi:hypothetical protein